MELPRVIVVMSTFNGEKFIREQIDSILRQKAVDIKLLIRDDGSIDNTASICKEYENRHNNVSFFQGKNIGVGRSFMELLRNAPEADYYSFADQDDVWLEDKLIRAINLMKRICSTNTDVKNKTVPITIDQIPEEMDTGSSKTPMLYASNQILVDSQLRNPVVRFHDTPKCDFYSSLTSNQLFGCTMVMNKELRNICCSIPLPSERVLVQKYHDSWVLYLAYITGIVIYDKESRILYRMHEKQVVGIKKYNSYQKVRDKFNRLITGKYRGIRSLLAKELIEQFSNQISGDVLKHLRVLAYADRKEGIIPLLRDDILIESFRERRLKVFIRAMMKWI